MFFAPGVGLAAPQVGIGKRIIVYDASACSKSSGGNGAGDSRTDESGRDTAGSGNDTAGSGRDTARSPSRSGTGEARAIINPEIISASGSLVSEKEACLSVPDFNANVKRFSRLTVKGLNAQGQKIQFDAEDIQAVILQHEIDHLDGILYIDRISMLKRNMYKKKILKKIKSNDK
ncbi:MAG: peptide deformylase [Desulfamplus sp.]|nr:peptide deformylase [Desulfamplus sp.]